MFLWLMLCLSLDADLMTVKEYELPEEPEYLSMVHSAVFNDHGKLFALDPTQPRILVWSEDGTFDRAFANGGQGPGELERPLQIASFDNKLYVWQLDGRMTVYNEDGTYQDNFLVSLAGSWPRRFALLDANRIFLNYTYYGHPGKVHYRFEIRNRKGDINQIAEIHNPGFVESRGGNNNVTVRAYMGDVDIQQDKNGQIWYGFGYERRLNRLTRAGETVEQRNFQLPSHKPSDEDRTYLENKEVVLSDGRRLRLKSLPNLEIEFDHDAAHFTQFVIRGDRVAFILTDQGGTDGAGDGSNRASYFVCEMASGKVLSRGAYHLEEGSQVHYRNGRIIAFELDKDGNYTIREVSLRGLD